MRTVDTKQFEAFVHLFPELTTREQLETALLLSLGLTRKEIAMKLVVEYISTEKTLDTLRRKFEFDSLNPLISMVQVRLALFALSGCIAKK